MPQALIGLESTAVQLEDPFGREANDLPIDLICKELFDQVEYEVS